MKINNKEEYIEFYPYKDKESIIDFPKEYPCICTKSWEDAGLMGTYWKVYVIYYPKNVTIEEAFEKGLNANWETLE